MYRRLLLEDYILYGFSKFWSLHEGKMTKNHNFSVFQKFLKIELYIIFRYKIINFKGHSHSDWLLLELNVKEWRRMFRTPFWHFCHVAQVKNQRTLT